MTVHQEIAERKPKVATVSADASWRPDLQALRALAVSLVVVYHLWPQWLPGGFVGVDVFFVLSGFLITSQIARQAERGTFQLRTFWGRRIRRLLPAAFLVLLCVALLTATTMPRTMWQDISQQILGSAFYVENWILGRNATDYLALASDASPLQHFWSLSIEEQFYIVWPLLVPAAIIGAPLLGKRGRNYAWVGLWKASLLVIYATSFGYSVYATYATPAPAYFSTFTRAWEFAAGGLCATVAWRLPRRSLAAIALLGVAMIGLAAVTFTGSSSFPGWIAAVPVVGACLVVLAGVREARPPFSLLFRGPVQLLGNISYSLYLWHWPVIVFARHFLGIELHSTQKLVLLALALVLAYLTKIAVEDPIRFGRVSTGRRPVFTAPGPAMLATGLTLTLALLVGVTGPMLATSARQSGHEKTLLAAATARGLECLGAAAESRPSTCQASADSPAVPGALIARDDLTSQECQQAAERSSVISCHFGSRSADALQVVLVGDSHANQWLPTVLSLANARGWSLTTYFKSGCGFLSAPRAFDRKGWCSSWNQEVTRDIVAGQFDLVIASGLATIAYFGEGVSGRAPLVRAIQDSWDAVKASGAHVVAIRDTPQPRLASVDNVPDCVSEHSRDVREACSFDRGQALAADPLEEASRADPAIRLLDFTQYFCPTTTCSPIVGGVLVYRDGDHMTATFARTLAPALGDALQPVLGEIEDAK